MNSIPLSEWRWSNLLYLHIKEYKNSDISFAFASGTDLASCHRDKYSTATMIYLLPFWVISRGPTISIPYQLNNVLGGIGWNSFNLFDDFFI